MPIKIKVRKRALRTPANTGVEIAKRDPSVDREWEKQQRRETADAVNFLECTIGIVLSICIFVYIFILDKKAPLRHWLPWVH